MTNEILETDIELARNLLQKGRAAHEVCMALAQRGIEPARAEQLVSDLVEGKQVQVDLPFRPVQRRSSRAAALGSPRPKEAAEESWESIRERGRQKSRPSPFSPASPYFSVGLAIAGAVIIGAVVMHNRHARKEMIEFNQPANPEKSVPQAKAGSAVESAAPIFEIDKQGLRLAKHTLTKTTIVNELTKLFGPPTRTNPLDNGNRKVYCYDKEGVLVYLDKNGTAESVVLDFSGMDGASGATRPCRGELIVAGHRIAARSTVAELAAIPELSIPAGKDGVGVLGTTYLGFDLVFSYFANPKQLSLLEIDFR
jgi:hypothetical protein